MRLALRCEVSSAPHRSFALSCSHDGYFVDLFVRKSNAVAIGMYEKVLLGGRRLSAAVLLTPTAS